MAPESAWASQWEAAKGVVMVASLHYWVLPLLPLGALIWFLLPTGHDEPTGSSRSAADPSPVTSGLYLTNVPNNWVSIGTVPNGYVGHDIYNRADEKLGIIKDILLDPDERMVAAIVNVDRFLGIGDKNVPVPMGALYLDRQVNRRRIILDATRETLQAAQAFGHHAPMR
jgi:hypothetical protein